MELNPQIPYSFPSYVDYLLLSYVQDHVKPSKRTFYYFGNVYFITKLKYILILIHLFDIYSFSWSRECWHPMLHCLKINGWISKKRGNQTPPNIYFKKLPDTTWHLFQKAPLHCPRMILSIVLVWNATSSSSSNLNLAKLASISCTGFWQPAMTTAPQGINNRQIFKNKENRSNTGV